MVKFMAMEPARSKSLHNFVLPCLKWRNQKVLRCVKVNSIADCRSTGFRIDNASVNGRRFFRDLDEKRGVKKVKKSEIECDDDDEEGIEAVREKVMIDLKTAADKMRDAILRENVRNNEKEEQAAEARPWNLRKRRASCKAPIDGGEPSYSPVRSDDGKWPRLRSGLKKERSKFAVPLLKKEIEEDYMAMIGERLPRRPKKRSKTLQKELDSIFPGLWLTEITTDTYKVPEILDNGKR